MTGMLMERRHWHPLIGESPPGGLSQHRCGSRVWGQGWGHHFLQNPCTQSSAGSTGPSWGHTEPLELFVLMHLP